MFNICRTIYIELYVYAYRRVCTCTSGFPMTLASDLSCERVALESRFVLDLGGVAGTPKRFIFGLSFKGFR